MKRVLFVLLLIHFCHQAKAESGYTLVPNSALQSQHDWDHIGISYAIQTFNYGFAKKALRFDTVDSFIFSLFMTTAITTMYGVMETGPGQPFPTHDLGTNALGAVLSVGTCLFFDF